MVASSLHARLGGRLRLVASSPTQNLSELPGEMGAPAAPYHDPGSWREIGRYLVLRKIGEGGMGSVYLAYDPELDRRIAIKLLRTPKLSRKIGRRGLDDEQRRLRREAQILARLSHPNVVAVHDVGEHAGQVFIGMEYVEGLTLAEKIEYAEPGIELLPDFLQAAKGLIAAHGVGLVHRDFKPENAVVGTDGRVRVMDFGLARDSDEDPAIIPAVTALPGTEQLTLPASTVGDGDVVGTPRYMSPEQWAGEPATTASDQFSFCVALWRAIFQEWPFEATDPTSVAIAVSRGVVTPPPRGIGVPRHVQAALLRGLSVDPAKRFESMEALVEALRGPPRRRPYFAFFAGAAAASLALVAGISLGAQSPCPDPEPELESAWNAERRASLLDKASSPSDAAALGELAGHLDDYGDRWLDQHRDSCAATRVRGEQSRAVMDDRMACLDEARQRLDQVVGSLAAKDRIDAADLQDARLSLVELSGCDAP